MNMSQYPEHLNPFAENSSKVRKSVNLSTSFKEFGKSIRQSFRIRKKKTDAVDIRKKDDAYTRPQVQSVPVPVRETFTPLLPRSRFKERLSKIPPNIPGSNPFADEQDNGGTDGKRRDEEQQLTMRRRHHHKKRAPLPPKSISSQNINDEDHSMPVSNSSWSLTSGDTDFSSYNQEGSERAEDSTSMTEKIAEFNRHMERLNHSSNDSINKPLPHYNYNNGSVDEIQSTSRTPSNNNIPDLVISCPGGDHDDQVPSIEVTLCESEKIESEEQNDDLVHPPPPPSHPPPIIEEDESVPENSTKDVEDDANANYVNKVSLFIKGSREELDSDKVINDDNHNITIIGDDFKNIDDNTDEDENCNKEPTPKQRKSKLTKNILLGTGTDVE